MPAKGKKAAAPKKKANGYKMPPPIPAGEVINDSIAKKKWRIGPSIGVGGFGEIYSACEHEGSPSKATSYPYVVKIEPHENGPLFVEKHFYVRNANKDDIETFKKSKSLSSLGMPQYYGSGSHTFNGEQYRYLVIERYGKDLWSLFKDAGRVFPAPVVFQIGLQMLDVLEYIHSRGYVHADLKGANILLGQKKGTENQAYLVDFGLATKLNDKAFKPDPKCAHNGTVEYTSRDAHLGVATMRGDLEILAYNMLQWLTGTLPWEQACSNANTVHKMKGDFMDHVRDKITKDYKGVPDALIKFFEYINSLQPKDQPDYTKCKQIFESYLKSEGKTRTSKLQFTPAKKSKTKLNNSGSVNSDKSKENGVAKPKRGRKPKAKPTESDNENDVPTDDIDEAKAVNTKKRKSLEPAVVVKVKKAKVIHKATPPAKKNHANIATQTSVEKARRSPRQVSFNSPICEIIGEKNGGSINSSGDIFDDSFVLEEKKVKPKRKLLAKQEVTVKRVVKKKLTTVGKKGKSWKDAPTVVNGRSPPK